MSTHYIIFGGTGSLGTALTAHIFEGDASATVLNASRDEWKQWAMSKTFEGKELSHRFCDIGSKERVREVMRTHGPKENLRIIVASALKHIDRCEDETFQTLQTNTEGVRNVCEALQVLGWTGVTVLFVSTDKACNPINVYGMSKSLGERIISEFAERDPKNRFIGVRYGNVLNSRGSIIPVLLRWQAEGRTDWTITHKKMTRFIMDMEESVALIWYALDHLETGYIGVPYLKSMRILDLFKLFMGDDGEERKIREVGLRPGEKIHEFLVGPDEVDRSSMIEGTSYMKIAPFWVNQDEKEGLIRPPSSISSDNFLLSPDELKHRLHRYIA